MKKQFLFTMLAAATVFTACQSKIENEVTLPQDYNGKVQFVIGEQALPMLKTTTNPATGVSNFMENDAIGIYSDGLGEGKEIGNERYTVQNGGTLTGKELYFNGENPATFYAYYPYAESQATAGNIAFTIGADQSTAELYAASDFMTAKATGTPPATTTVSFRFAHRLALVKVAWEASTTATAITMNGVKPTVNWDFANDALTTDDAAQVLGVKMWKTTADAQEYWAVVPAQTFTAGTPLFSITDGTKTFSYTPQNDVTLTANKVKKFTLQAGPSGEVVSIVTEMEVAAWGEEENYTGNGSLEEAARPMNKILDGDLTGVTLAKVTNRASIPADSWGYMDNGDQGTFEVADNALKVTFTAFDKWKWYSQAFFYHGTLPAETTTRYRLSFDVSSDYAASIRYAVFATNNEGEGANVNRFFCIENGEQYTTQAYATLTEKEGAFTAQCTRYIEFSKTSTAASGNVDKTAANDASALNQSAFYIYIAPRGADGGSLAEADLNHPISFSNIKLEEVPANK